MKRTNQKGFSLIELIVVVTIIAIVAAIGIPSLQKGILAAELGSAVAAMRTMHSTQVAFYSTNNRFARLDELNASQGGALGQLAGNTIIRKNFTYRMEPLAPTDSELRQQFTIVANRPPMLSGETPYLITVTQQGRIVADFLVD